MNAEDSEHGNDPETRQLNPMSARSTSPRRAGRISPAPGRWIVRTAALVALTWAAGLHHTRAAGQEPPPPTGAPPPADSAREPGGETVDERSPLGAMLRSLALPGWGHAYAGATTRGGVYLAFEAGSAYAVLRTRNRLAEANERIALRERGVRADLAELGITHSTYVEEVLAQDEAIADLRELRDERDQQVEDWLAFGGFMFLLGAADAYVSTHLRAVPSPVTLNVDATPDGRVDVGFMVSLGGRRERVGIEPTRPGFSRAARF